jgi:hypothetical protein
MRLISLGVVKLRFTLADFPAVTRFFRHEHSGIVLDRQFA